MPGNPAILRRVATAMPGALFAMTLAGCINLDVGGKTARPSPSYFDLAGSMPADSAAESQTPAISLRTVDVVAPTWLDTPAMQYRLAYADPARRASFAESRWVAPPPELLEQSLRRRLASGGTQPGQGACRLQIDLDEFVQNFESAQSSIGVIELRAALLASRSDVPLARKTFRASRPAQSADARGGVAALSAATSDVSTAVRDWVYGLSADSVNGISQRCRAN